MILLSKEMRKKRAIMSLNFFTVLFVYYCFTQVGSGRTLILQIQIHIHFTSRTHQHIYVKRDICSPIEQIHFSNRFRFLIIISVLLLKIFSISSRKCVLLSASAKYDVLLQSYLIPVWLTFILKFTGEQDRNGTT